jgi:hypothetical protein
MEAAEQSMWHDAAAELSAIDMEDDVPNLSNNPFVALDEGALRTLMARRHQLRAERIAEGVRRRAAALAERERLQTLLLQGRFRELRQLLRLSVVRQRHKQHMNQIKLRSSGWRLKSMYI